MFYKVKTANRHCDLKLNVAKLEFFCPRQLLLHAVVGKVLYPQMLTRPVAAAAAAAARERERGTDMER
jgi:hypothetical protein